MELPSESLLVDQLDENQYVDVTERIEVYQNGKVWSCDCGQDIGTGLKTKSIMCASCGTLNIDVDWGSRESPEEDNGENGQTSLSSFL